MSVDLSAGQDDPMPAIVRFAALAAQDIHDEAKLSKQPDVFLWNRIQPRPHIEPLQAVQLLRCQNHA